MHDRDVGFGSSVWLLLSMLAVCSPPTPAAYIALFRVSAKPRWLAKDAFWLLLVLMMHMPHTVHDTAEHYYCMHSVRLWVCFEACKATRTRMAWHPTSKRSDSRQV